MLETLLFGQNRDSTFVLASFCSGTQLAAVATRHKTDVEEAALYAADYSEPVKAEQEASRAAAVAIVQGLLRIWLDAKKAPSNLLTFMFQVFY